MFERKNQTILSDHYLNMTGNKARGDGEDESEDEDGGFMTVKRKDHELNEEELPDLSIPVSKRQAKKALSRKATLATKGNPTKLKFDDDGVAHAIYELEDEEDFKKAGDAKQQKEEFVNREREAMKVTDLADKEVERQKRQEKKRKRKETERRMREEAEGFSDDEGNQL